jgi:hypothetical protein
VTLDANARLGRFGVDHGRMAAWIDTPHLVVVATDLGTACRCLEVAAESLGLRIVWPESTGPKRDRGARDAGS